MMMRVTEKLIVAELIVQLAERVALPVVEFVRRSKQVVLNKLFPTIAREGGKKGRKKNPPPKKKSGSARK